MTNKTVGSWIVLITISFLLIAAYSEAAEQQVVMQIDGMTCDL
jgi:hypothetical protein